MTILNKQGVLMDKWFKAPNAIVDDITGDIISPQAATILYAILRLTEGVRGRSWAAIPHSFFMRKTQSKRRETIAKYIKELTDSELININKSNGKVTEYAINWQSSLWYSVEKVEVKAVSSVPVRFIRTSTPYPYIPVRLNRTGQLKTSTFHPYTYKDIEPKDNTKDKKMVTEVKKTKKPTVDSVEKQQEKSQPQQLVNFWNENHGKGSSADIKPSVWIDTVKARLKKFTADEIKTAMLSVIQSTWHQQNGQVLIKNAISSDKRCDEAISRHHQAQANKSQGARYENNQQPSHNRQQPVKQSSADAYEENLARELAERFPDEFPADHCF